MSNQKEPSTADSSTAKSSADETVNITYEQEGWRKATHFVALIMPISYLFLSKAQVLYVLIPASFVFFLFDTARLRSWRIWDSVSHIWGPMVRPKEHDQYTGATWIMIGVVITIRLFSKPVAICAIVFIILGDIASALVGRKLGKHRFGDKSFEGSAAFFLVCLIPAALVPGMEFWVATIGAAIATVTEAVSKKVDDNLSVPLVSGLCMHLITRYLA